MMYENRNAAYDLNLFKDNTAKELPKKEDKVSRKNKVVNLPQEELMKIRKRKHNPFVLFIGGVATVAITMIVATIIIGQVQLTELNQEVIYAQTKLANAQSTYTQLEMAVQSKLSTAEIENYAENTLGMSKAGNAHKEFVSLSEGDKVEISSEANKNFFQKTIDAIKGLWS